MASVNNGSVKGLKSGTAVITVKTADGNKTASCTIKVSVPTVAVSGISLDKASATLNIGQNLTLAATVSPANATDKSVTWSSSNTAVATVTNGTVTAKAAGTATITVKTNNNKTATCVISVPEPFVAVTGIALNRTAASVSVGRTVILVATVSPENATNKTVTWRSSDSSIVSVGSNGVAKAEKIGTATVTATTLDGNKTASCEITVAPVSVTGVKLDASSISLYVGENRTLTATVSPSNATNASVTWKSSNTAVASVNRYGKLTANADGKAEITVTTQDGSKTASCIVTVTTRVYSVTGVFLNKSEETLDIDGTVYLSATVLPLNATNKAVTWSSSNTSVAKVFTNGTVTAVGVGTAVITVKTADGAKTATCTVTVKRPLSYTLPDVSTAALLLPEFSGRFNKIKQLDRPAFTSVKKVKFSDIKLEGAVGGAITESIFQSLFDSLNEDETVTMSAVSKGINDYSEPSLNKYIRAIPVIGYGSSVRVGLNTNAINMEKSGLKNDNESTYELSIALNNETLNTLPTNSTDTSSHGKMFDILYQKYIDDCKEELSDAKLDYSAFKTTYHDSSVTVTIDKATDRVIKAVYDMNVKVEISNLKIYSSTISTASFDVNSHTDITFTY